MFKLKNLLPVSHAAFSHTSATDPLQSFMFTVEFVFKVMGDDGDESRVTTYKRWDTAKSQYVEEDIPTTLNDKIGFQKVNGLNANLNVVEYHEGRTNYPMKLAGKANFGEVTMEKGVIPYVADKGIEETENVLDFLQYFAMQETLRMDVYVHIMGRNGKTRATYILKDALITKWEAPDLDASSDEVSIEKIAINYDYFEYDDDIPDDEFSSFTQWTPLGVSRTDYASHDHSE